MSTATDDAVEELARCRTFLTRVRDVAPVTPRVRRITCGGGDLTGFAPLGPDTFLHLLLPPPGRDELTVDASFTWQRYATMPEEDRPVGAYYTVRAWRPDVAEIDLLVVLHEPAGPASGWAATARPGDPVAVWGPRERFTPPDDTDWYLLVADETGLPAVAAILDHLPAEVPVRVVADVAGPEEHQLLPARAGVEVTWVHRDGHPPGAVADRVLEAVRGVTLPPGSGYVWGGAEAATIRRVRRHARRALRLEPARISVVDYWRR